MKRIPKYLRSLFWDTNIDTFDPVEYPRYTIGRILEFGDEKAMIWLKRAFSERQITDVIKSEHRLTPKSANFWASVYGIPSSEVAALKE